MKAGNAYVHALLVLVGLTSFFLLTRDGPWNATRVVGLAILLPAFALWFVARLQLGRSFSVRAQAKELVTRGLYSKVRHPVYLFGALGVLGVILYSGRLEWLWVFAALVPLQLLRIHKEEEVLSEKFGEKYLEYKRKTWF